MNYTPIVSNDIEGISRNAHLLLSVWDYDLTNEDDVIGLTRIPFSEIFEAARKENPTFTINLSMRMAKFAATSRVKSY